MPSRAVLRELSARRIQRTIDALRATDHAARAAADEARAKRTLYPHFSNHVNAPAPLATARGSDNRRSP